MPFRVDATSKTLSADTLAKWQLHRVTGDVEEVPGIGPAARKLLAEAGVETTFQLCGKMLSFKGEEVGSQALCDQFFEWLKSIGINSKRSDVTLAIAEKCALAFPGSFERTELVKGDGGMEE